MKQRLAMGIVLFLFLVWRLGLRGVPAGTLPQPLGGTPTIASYLPFIENPPLPTETPTPTPTITPAPLAWLNYLNGYRAQALLPALSQNSDWSNGGWLHARYMVKNDLISHDEDPQNLWYTAEGQAAAQNGNVMVSSSSQASDESAIDLWMSGPFHAIGILDPALHQTGFGSYREADGGWQMGATLDVIRGLGAIPPTVAYPVMWPADNQTTFLNAYYGTEFPDPLTSCPDYVAPSGLPILLQIGDGSLTPSVTDHSFSQDGLSLDHCLFDETNYSNPDSGSQSLGRLVLSGRDAIVLIPRQPLSPAGTYTVSITVNGQSYQWTFTVAAIVQPHSPAFVRQAAP